MVLPLIFGALGGALGGAGMLGGLGALGAGAIGSGLGSYMETGDLEKGIMTGLGSFAGGALLGPMLGGGASAAGAAANTPAVGAGLAKGAIPGATGAAALPMRANLATLGSGANAMNAVAKPGLAGIGRGAMDFAKSGAGIGTMLGGTAGGMASGMFGGNEPEKEKYESRNDLMPIPRTMGTPPTGYRPGFDAEFNYGLSTPQSASSIRDYNRRFYGGGVVNSLGPIKLAAGGIAALGGMDQAEMNAPEGGNEKTVVTDAIKAIKGEIEDPRVPLGKFLALYGEDALRDLVEKVKEGKAEGEASKDGGRVRGPGDGMDDRVPAQIKETGEDVLLADSEYIVPADVVSGLGNGSSDAGAKVLDSMLERVRMERTGKKEQPKAIDPKKAVPA